MIPLETVQEIQRLLSEGRLSQGQIAKKLGVSRTFVNFVNRGRLRTPLEARIKDDPEREPMPRRCPECGALVYMPCIACRTRAYMAWQRRQQKAGVQRWPFAPHCPESF
jgi:DNA-binding XRE family transcriptional regulator